MARVFDTPDKVRQLARCCDVSDNHTYKWLRDGGTGAPSNLDRLCRIIFLASTFGADGMRGTGLIADYVRECYVSLVELGAEPYQDEHARVVDSTETLREAAEAVEALSLGRPTPEAVKEVGGAAGQGGSCHLPPLRRRGRDGGRGRVLNAE